MDPTTHIPFLSFSPFTASATHHRFPPFTERRNPLAAVLARGKPTLPSGFAAHSGHPYSFSLNFLLGIVT
ncbi:hypothetical protein HanXRQr2_Chr15g0710291 [Helianthus annuus]|uniref:Uncharacterized protein n=1 Tax=Helianthus annuus TaxID=4232 RepID=A0A9K3E333_HELAN|nr:hypothetical protein HanXRQr2_Chr15g0710291 [Helianthus annuus]